MQPLGRSLGNKFPPWEKRADTTRQMEKRLMDGWGWVRLTKSRKTAMGPWRRIVIMHLCCKFRIMHGRCIGPTVSSYLQTERGKNKYTDEMTIILLLTASDL